MEHILEIADDYHGTPLDKQGVLGGNWVVEI